MMTEMARRGWFTPSATANLTSTLWPGGSGSSLSPPFVCAYEVWINIARS